VVFSSLDRRVNSQQPRSRPPSPSTPPASPATRRLTSAYRFYRFRTERLKVFDEAVFGAGVFVTATIHSGQQLVWERTDISSGAEAN
jgi:hypothetical protein